MPVWYPEACRGGKAFNSKFQKQYESKNGKLRTHANEYARIALRRAMGLPGSGLDEKWHACHIWGRNVVRDARYYSCIGNMVFLPAPLKAFTDSVPEIMRMLRICAYHLYGWLPRVEEAEQENREIRHVACRRATGTS